MQCRSRVFEWHKCFNRGGAEVDNDPKMRQPSMMKMEQNIDRVKQVLRSDRRLTVEMMAKQLSLNRKSVSTTLVRSGGCEKCMLRWYPRLCRMTRKSTVSMFDQHYFDLVLLPQINKNFQFSFLFFSILSSMFSVTMLHKRYMTRPNSIMSHKSLKQKNKVR